MKATGMVRRIDDLGRLVLPIEIRRTFDIDVKDPIEIFVDDTSIILKKYIPCCIFCGNSEENINYKGKNICTKCISEMQG